MRTEPLIPPLRHATSRPDPVDLLRTHDAWQAMTAELKPPLTAAEAQAESQRCLLCGGPYAEAPCTAACPADVDVPGFIEAIGRGDTADAARIILDANPLGATCARVCPTEVLCEGACVLLHEGQRAVDIGRLQRYAMDMALSGDSGAAVAPGPRNGRTVTVIGAGPAGMAGAAELAALRYAVTVLDERSEVGGLVRYAIAPYRQLDDPLPLERERLERLGVRVRMNTPIDTPERLRALEATSDAILLAVGMGEDTTSGCPGEELAGVWPSLRFVEAIKAGRLPEVGERVVVVGGGNTAMDMAREAVRLGAGTVTVLYRRTEAEMPAYRHEVEEAKAEGVQFSWLTLPTRFLGQGRLKAVECRRMRLGEPDASGRRRPEAVPGSEFTLPADTAILAIGQRPRSQFLAWIDGVEVRGGRLASDPETGATGNPRYFAAGDAVNGGDTVVMAVRMGKAAAHAIDARLTGAGARR